MITVCTLRTNTRYYTPFGDSIAEKTTPSIRMGLFFIVAAVGLEPISLQLSGGQLRQPVQKLVATIMSSSPSSTTRKNTGFRKKSGVFLTFRDEIHTRKTGVELALELAAQNTKIEY